MKNLVASAFALALFASPALSQSMRESHQNYQSERRFIGRKTPYGGNFIYAVFGNGNVHICPEFSSSCKDGAKKGTLNKRYRDDWGDLNEFYIENGNLIWYQCSEGDYMECDDAPTKEILRPQ